MMPKLSRFLSAALLLALATPIWAQEATTETAPAAETTTTPDPANDLAMGTPVDDGVLNVGEPYVREEFGDWAMRCLKAEEGQPDPCQLYQLLLDQASNPVAEVSMFPLPAGSRAAAGATIVAPLETLLTAALTIAVDDGTPRQYPFTFCNPGGCVARVGFTQAEIDEFKAGGKATMTIVPAVAPDEPRVLTISLVGFTAGYEAAAATAPAQ
jgi:invasion protein IalB